MAKDSAPGRSGGHSAPGRSGGQRRYPRSARVNELLREVVAEQLERLADVDERLELVTVTGVNCDPDLRHATVLFSTLEDDEAQALEAQRVRLQSAVSRQVRMKRTPHLSFRADPAIASGRAVEDTLRRIHEEEEKGQSGGRHAGDAVEPDGRHAGDGASE